MLLSQIRKYSVPPSLLIWITAALVAVVGAWTLPSASRAGAVAARGGAFHEIGHLHRTSKNGASFTEQGPSSGTYNGTLTLYLTTTQRGVTFRMSGNTSGGTLSGRGSATVESEAKIAKVVGTAVFTGGTGRYAHARVTGLKVSGTLNRESYFLVVTFDGHLSY